MQEKKRLSIIFIPTLIAIDQISKYIIRLRQPAEGGFYICNKGVAFGIKLPEIIIFILLLCFFFIFYFLIFRQRRRAYRQAGTSLWLTNFKFQISNFSVFETTPAILILSGGISNLIDRIYFGCVIDFIDLKFWPVFNLADIYITIGAIMIIISLCLPKSSPPRQSA
jgi:signal peptidase II